MNPYAAPKAKLEEPAAQGAVWREGDLVRVARDGELPGRCLVCNQPAHSRVRRRLYASPLAWRLGASATPFVLLFLGIAVQVPVLIMLVWPSVLVLMVAHLFVRRKFVLEAPICARHARLRSVLLVLSILLVCAVIALPFSWAGTQAMVTALWACVAALILLAVVQSLAGVQAVRLKRLSPEHAWLGGTGKPFREALPELPG